MAQSNDTFEERDVLQRKIAKLADEDAQEQAAFQTEMDQKVHRGRPRTMPAPAAPRCLCVARLWGESQPHGGLAVCCCRTTN